jgi:hypothetical protein
MLGVEQLVVGALISIAVAIRLTYYFSNPSLSVDEADLALNLMHRSYSDVLGRLDFNQAAPAGFLLLQKVVVNSLGATPYALRLVPLTAGILSSFLIYPVATRFVGRRAAIIALAFFAVSDPLMSFAATNKQYSVDVGVALALYAVALALPTGVRGAGILALTGIVAVWLSHPAAFILAGIVVILIIERAKKRRWREAGNLLAVGIACLASFLVAYLLTRASVEQIQHSIAKAGDSTPLGSHGQLSRLRTFGGIVRNLLGISTFAHGRSTVAVVGILFALVGLIVLLRSRPSHAALLVLPIAFALIATAVHLYPRYPRVFLFFIPPLLILVAGGGSFLAIIGRSRVIALVGAAGLAVLFGATVSTTIDHLRLRPEAQPIEVLRYLAENARSGDSLYLYLTSQYDFRYYLECGCFGRPSEIEKARSLWPVRPASGYSQFSPALRSAPPRIIAGVATSGVVDDYAAEFEPLRGRTRVWVLLLDPNPEGRRAIEAFLSRIGTRKAFFPRSAQTSIANVSLYDLHSHP